MHKDIFSFHFKQVTQCRERKVDRGNRLHPLTVPHEAAVSDSHGLVSELLFLMFFLSVSRSYFETYFGINSNVSPWAASIVQ